MDNVKEVKCYLASNKDFSIYEYDGLFRVTVFIPISKYSYKTYEIAEFYTLEEAKKYIEKISK